MVSSIVGFILVAASGFVSANVCDAKAYQPDDAALARAHETITSPVHRNEIGGAVQALRNAVGSNDTVLLTHIAYQVQRGKTADLYSEEEQWQAVFLVNQLHEEMAETDQLLAMVSLLVVREDTRCQEAGWFVAYSYERPDFKSKVNYSKYEDFLQACFKDGRAGVEALTDYLFQRNAVDTLDFVVNLAKIEGERRAELTRANEIGKKLYPKDHRAVRVDVEPTPEELVVFLDAMQGEEWWLPLYFSEVVRKTYALQTEGVLAQLRAIEHPAVQESLRAMEAQDPVKPVPPARWMVFEKQ